MKYYRYNGTHADFLKSGRPVAPGEIVRISKQEEDEPLIASGLMVEVRQSRKSPGNGEDHNQKEA